jgi:molecular chaperone GrpE
LQRELDRARGETREQRRAALRPLLLDVLDLRDRLAAALKMPAAPRARWPQRLWRRPSGQGEAWQEGLRMLLDRFDHVLQGRGVQTMRLVGQPFDPQLARVIGTAAAGSAADGLVLEEVRAGYFWESQVLRTAEVIVSKAGTGQGEPS